MSDAEPEYEVESIVEARTETEGGGRKGRKGKLVWKYRVRWKGYPPDEDTWEPTESVEGASDAVNAFWEKANTGGRDRNNLSLFKAGEAFLPLGPPRKIKSKSSSTQLVASTSQATPSASSKKRGLDEGAQTSVSQRTSKRRRADAPATPLPTTTDAPALSASASAGPKNTNTRKPPSSRSSAKKPPAKTDSQEIIPDSESEEEIAMLDIPSVPKRGSQEKPKDNLHPSGTNGSAVPSTPTPSTSRRAPALVPVTPKSKLPPQTATKSPGERHSKRLAMDSNEKGKAPDVPATTSASTRTKRPRPGPGRSSGGLVESTETPARASKRRRANATEPNQEDEPHPAAPSPRPAEDESKVPGTDACESPTVAAEEQPQVVEEKQPVDPEELARQERINKVKDQLFPTTSSPLSPSLGGWGKPTTIFGPLGFGLSTSSASTLAQTTQAYLTLDSSLSIPIGFYEGTTTDIQLSTAPGAKGTPGKFYRPEAALALLNSVQPKGGFALARVGSLATSEEMDHFTQFSTRLTSGDLFVAVAGVDILVFYAATNTQFAQRLNTPPSLVNRSQVVVVTKVDIVDFSRYAEAAAGADPSRWVEYVKALTS